MIKRASDVLQKAKNYAFLLLKVRQRSEKEIQGRLKRKKFDDDIIREVLSFLKEKAFINDTDFTKSWIESRLQKRLGLRRIEQELKVKGIERQTIERELREAKKGYVESEIVLRIARDRLGRLKDIEPQKAKRRIFSYLARRGFSPEIIFDVINNL